MLNAPGVERTGAAHQSVHLVALFQQKLCQIGAVLTRDAGDQSFFIHVNVLLGTSFIDKNTKTNLLYNLISFYFTDYHTLALQITKELTAYRSEISSVPSHYFPRRNPYRNKQRSRNPGKHNQPTVRKQIPYIRSPRTQRLYAAPQRNRQKCPAR